MNKLFNRYIPLKDFYSYLDEKYPDKLLLGHSVLGNPIYKIEIGKGERKVLIWSQMHGNESTGTRAMLSLFESLSERELTDADATISYVPILNPDGADKWTRRNALGIDINRDFLQEKSPEIQILKREVFTNNYNLLINLHDQRSIFAHPKTNKPATISVLAPSPDESKSINGSRKYLMNLIGTLCDEQMEYQSILTRFSDDYYPTSTGDNFVKLGYPCLLVESGHFENDYQRNKSVELTATFLSKIIFTNVKNGKQAIYQDIPISVSNYRDVCIRNYPISYGDNIYRLDISIQYVEFLNDNKLCISPKVDEVGDVSHLSFWKIIDASELTPSNKIPQIGEVFIQPQLFPEADEYGAWPL